MEILKFVTGETALKSKKIWKIGKIIYLLRAWENSGSDLDKRQNNIENYPTFLKQVTDITLWSFGVFRFIRIEAVMSRPSLTISFSSLVKEISIASLTIYNF